MFEQSNVWRLIEKIGNCMMITNRAGRLRGRPMHALPDKQSGKIHFLTDVGGEKDDEVARTPAVCLTFSDGAKYLSISGSAAVSRDVAKIRALWSTEAQAWWASPDDPNIRLVTVTPISAEYWEDPGKRVSAVDFAVAAASGVRQPLNPSHKVEMR